MDADKNNTLLRYSAGAHCNGKYVLCIEYLVNFINLLTDAMLAICIKSICKTGHQVTHAHQWTFQIKFLSDHTTSTLRILTLNTAIIDTLPHCTINTQFTLTSLSSTRPMFFVLVA